MGLVKKIKTINWGYLWLAVLIGGAGILILAYPNKTLAVVAITVGVVTLLLGAVQAIRVLSDKKRGFRFAVGIVAASVTAIAGILCLILRDKIAEFIPSLVSLFLIIDASFKLSFIVIRMEGGDAEKILMMFGLSLIADALGNLFSFFFIGSVQKAEREKILKENVSEPPAEGAEDAPPA